MSCSYSTWVPPEIEKWFGFIQKAQAQAVKQVQASRLRETWTRITGKGQTGALGGGRSADWRQWADWNQRSPPAEQLADRSKQNDWPGSWLWLLMRQQDEEPAGEQRGWQAGGLMGFLTSTGGSVELYSRTYAAGTTGNQQGLWAGLLSTLDRPAGGLHTVWCLKN